MRRIARLVLPTLLLGVFAFVVHFHAAAYCCPGCKCYGDEGTAGSGVSGWYTDVDTGQTIITDWDRGTYTTYYGGGHFYTAPCPAGTYGANDGCYGIGFSSGGYSYSDEEGGDEWWGWWDSQPAPTPTPPMGIVKAKAVTWDSLDFNCDDVFYEATAGAVTALPNVSFTLNGDQSTLQTQTGDEERSWDVVAEKHYELNPTYPLGDYMLYKGCILNDANESPFVSYGYKAWVVTDQTVKIYPVFVEAGPFSQAKGGNVYAAESLLSQLPFTLSPRYFLLDAEGPSASASPGIVSYGNEFDVDMDNWKIGLDIVSTKNWLTYTRMGKTDWYGKLSAKIDALGTSQGYPTVLEGTSPIMTSLYPDPTIYTKEGDLAISNAWDVADGESFVIRVTGNLTLAAPIRFTGETKNASIVFLVKGDVTVDPSVGEAYSSSEPDLEGVFITGGTFHTGASTVVGKERLVVKGTVVANDIKLQRDLESVLQNAFASSELFEFNPQLLFTFPHALLDTSYFWQEVAP